MWKNEFEIFQLRDNKNASFKISGRQLIMEFHLQ